MSARKPNDRDPPAQHPSTSARVRKPRTLAIRRSFEFFPLVRPATDTLPPELVGMYYLG